jgi:hypothetical protein
VSLWLARVGKVIGFDELVVGLARLVFFSLFCFLCGGLYCTGCMVADSLEVLLEAVYEGPGFGS